MDMYVMVSNRVDVDRSGSQGNIQVGQANAAHQKHVDEDVVGVEVGEEEEVADLHAEEVEDVGEARITREGLCV